MCGSISTKYGTRARANDRARGGEEAERRRDDRVARLNAAAGDGEPQGVRPGSAAHGVIDSEERRDLALKGLDFLAQNEVLRRAHALDRGQNFLANRGVLTPQVEHGDPGHYAGRRWNAAAHG